MTTYKSRTHPQHLVPTAAVVPSGGYSLEMQNDRPASGSSADTLSFVNAEYGLFGNFEFGIDADYTSGYENSWSAGVSQ